MKSVTALQEIYYLPYIFYSFTKETMIIP